MRILEFGTPGSPVLILIHGFEMPWQLLFPCIDRYKTSYHILVPVLPGHDVKEPSEFTSFEDIARELEDFCLSQTGDHVAVVYGLSMGGLVAARLWQNGRLTIGRLIMESSPILPFPGFAVKQMTRTYLKLTRKARERAPGTLQKAAGAMIPPDQLDMLLSLLDGISDSTVEAYTRQVGEYALPGDLEPGETRLVYFYGSKLAELPFRKAAGFLEAHYPGTKTVCLRGKGHCEDALLWPERWLRHIAPYL